MCWWSSGLYVRRFTARSGWWVVSCGFAPEPELPVAATVCTGPASIPARASGRSPSAMVVAKQPGRGDVPRLGDRRAVHLGHPVDEDAVGQRPGRGVGDAVVLLVGRGVAQPEVAREVDDADARSEDRLDDLGRRLVRHGEERHVHPGHGLLGGHLLEGEVGEPGEAEVHVAHLLADVVRGGDARDLDLRVEEEPAEDLRAAVPGAADEDCLETSHDARAPCQTAGGQERERRISAAGPTGR